MALLFECMQSCAQKCLTRADIVRDAIFRQLTPRTGSGLRLRSGVTSRKAALLMASRSRLLKIQVRKSPLAMNRRQHPRFAFRLLSLCMLILALGVAASAEWKEKVLYSFQGIPDGSQPAGGVVFDQVGNLYGATTGGGSSSCVSFGDCGVVYQLTPPAKKGGSWTEAVLYVFKGNASNDGATPGGSLLIDGSGNLYGTTAYGGAGGCIVLGTKMGCGAVYEMKPPQTRDGKWRETVLYSFRGGKDGDFPVGSLTFDKLGNLYGVTQYGGGYGSCNAPYFQYCGTVFKLSQPKTKSGKWQEKVLYSFKSGTDGANPNGGLVFDTKGSIYGTTYAGGNQNCKYDESVGCGTAFELKPSKKKDGTWAETRRHVFTDGSDGRLPSCGLIFDASGAMYGAAEGGVKMGGVVFRLSSASDSRWKETVIYGFKSDSYTYTPAVAVFDKSGNLYGTTNVGPSQSLAGSVFRLKPPNQNGGSWSFSLLRGFTGVPDAAFPNTNLSLDKSGDLYGTTQAGGTGTGCGHGGCGTVFEVSP